MTYEAIELSCKDGVAKLTLNRPHVLNAINERMVLDIRQALRDLVADNAVRALLLTANGRGFCSGADLGADTIDFDSAAPINDALIDGLANALNPMLLEIRDLPFPTVAAVNGVVAGGGIGLALSCDIVLAARSAKFVSVFLPKLGIIPDMGVTWHFPVALGPARARAITFLGESFSSKQAESWGLIWRSVEDDQLIAEASALATRLAAGPRLAYPAARAAIAGAGNRSFASQLAAEAQIQSELTASADFREGVMAFRQGREPRFEQG